MSRNWTDNQKLAIDARNGSLLVSAAAGSGKTAVLVERVMSMITDAENPVPIDKLLIVTFTVAAANELKERITKTLQGLISKNPENKWYRRQLMYMPYANISTVDSFCSSTVREFSQVLGISDDYKIGESGEIDLLTAEAIDETMEFMYSQNSRDFIELVETYAAAKDDDSIGNHIKKLYAFLRSHPFSDKWLSDKQAYYDNVTDMKESVWGQIIKDYVISLLNYCKDISKASIKLVEEEIGLSAKATPIFMSDIDSFDDIIDVINTGKWDDICDRVNSFKLKAYRIDAYKDHPLKLKAGLNREIIKENLKQLRLIFRKDEAECLYEINTLAPIVKKLFESVKVYGEIYSRKKAEKNLADFNDISHWMLKLLVRLDKDGNTELTEYAHLISERFREVMVDEYQDANEVQDLIYYAVSRRGTNLFTVGDVKQSIYGFRQAMPEIFLSRKNTLPLYSRALDNYPSKVILEKNFRSRKEVTDFINFAFSLLMSVETGDLVYNEEEALYPQAPYPDADSPCCELHLIDMDYMGDVDKAVAEARYIALLIHKMCKDTYITDKGERRLVRYGDFSIIMRKKEGYTQVYASELRKMGVPAMTAETTGFLSSPEIVSVTNLLRVVDNPLQDIPLTSVLMSPIFGFTADDMALIRLKKRHTHIYNALKLCAEDGNVKCIDFLKRLAYFRNLAVTEPCNVFIEKLYDELHVPAVFTAAWGKATISNLRLLVSYAEKYEQNSSRGVASFVHYLNRLEEEGTDLPAAVDSESADLNAVSVMSVHASKGLEFPVCIIANMGRNFSSDTKKDIMIHSKLGFASKLRDKEISSNFTTIVRDAVSLEIDRGEKSEELRVLYVAMTRAKERLIMVSSHPKLQRFVEGVATSLAGNSEISPFVVRNCSFLSEWPIMCALLHPNGGDLRDFAHMDTPPTFACKDTGNLKTVIVTGMSSEDEFQETTQTITNSTIYEKIPENTGELLRERFDFVYPYIELSRIPQKVTASELAHSKSDKPLDRVLPVPDFIKEKTVSGVSRGTAMHTYLEHCDFSLARTDISEDIERIRALGYLTDEQVALLDTEKLKNFVKSIVADMVLSSEKVIREYKFTVNIPAKLVEENISPEFEDTPVVLQGAVDLLIIDKDGIIIVDYKTDRVKDADVLLDMYGQQLMLYREAVSRIFSLPVKSCLIYSVHLSEIKEVLV